MRPALVLAAEGAPKTNVALTFSLFVAFIVLTLGIIVWAGRRTRTATDFYAAGRSISGVQNGIAIAGDYMSAASFLGIAGLIALFGYDGFLYSVGFLVAYLVVLLVVAELLRNSGRFTLADVLSYRMRQGPVRTAVAVSTISVSLFYLLAQMVGAGTLVSLLLNIKGDAAANWTILGVGILMIFYVAVGGMVGTTWVQIVKAVLLLAGTALLSVLVLNKFGWSVNAMFHKAAEASGKGDKFLEPGLRYGKDATGKIDLISLGIALVLGTAGLPHILTRFYTVPDAKAARKSVNWAIGLIGGFYLLTTFLGFGAAALVGPKAIKAANKAGNLAAPQLAEKLGGGAGTTGGALLLAVISAVAFATILAVVAGLTLASSASFAHDLYSSVFKRGDVREGDEVRVARIATVVIGVLAVLLSIYAKKQNVAFLVGLAFAIAASANLPTLLFSLFWKRFTTTGAVAGIYGGLVSALVLVVFSPVVSGTPTALFPKSDWHWFPLENPGIVSIPFGFLCAIVGTLLSKDPVSEARFTELEVRALTGVGAH